MLSLNFSSTRQAVSNIRERISVLKRTSDSNPRYTSSILKAKHIEYSTLYEGYFLEFLNLFLSTEKIKDISNLQQKFNSCIVMPDKSNDYCNYLVKTVNKGLDNLKKFVVSRGCSSDELQQSVYSFMGNNADKLLDDNSLAYIINVGENISVHSYTSSAFMKKHGLEVIEELSSAKASVISAYKYNQHWYLAFKVNDKYYVIDPNNQGKAAFLLGHKTTSKELKIEYIALDVAQSDVGSVLGTCGKICIAVNNIFAELLKENDPIAICDTLTEAEYNSFLAAEIKARISLAVLELVKEDNPYYFESKNLISSKTPYDVYYALGKMSVVQKALDEYYNFSKELLLASCFEKYSSAEVDRPVQLIASYYNGDHPYLKPFNFTKLYKSIKDSIEEASVFGTSTESNKLIDIVTSYYHEVPEETGLSGEATSITVVDS